MFEGKKYVVRASLTRCGHPKAVLRDLGAKVLEGDLNDKGMVEAALKGAGWGLPESNWDHFSKVERSVSGGKPSISPFFFSCSFSCCPPWMGSHLPSLLSGIYEIHVLQVDY